MAEAPAAFGAEQGGPGGHFRAVGDAGHFRGADQIVVVNGGRSQDVGTHGELLKNCPLYQEMWRAHMGAKEGEQA